MLELAYLHKDFVLIKLNKCSFVDKYKYYFCGSYIEYEKDLADSTWKAIEYVSIDNGKIVGFLGAYIDREIYAVQNLRAINFTDKNIVFAKDFYSFLEKLLEEFNFYKIKFNVVVGNPAEKMYDRFIKKYNGEIVGVNKKDVKLWDGKLYDMKYYEIFKDDYERSRYGKEEKRKESVYS